MNKLNLIPVDVYQTSLVNKDNYIYTFYIKDYKHVSNKAKAIYKHYKKLEEISFNHTLTRGQSTPILTVKFQKITLSARLKDQWNCDTF